MVPEQIRREVYVAAPIERVWSVITEAEHVGTWFGDAGAEVDLRPGGTLVCRWKDYGTVRAVIEAVEPPTRFAYRWAGPLGEEPSQGNATLVEFTLRPEGQGTRVRVVERGFRGLHLPEEEQDRYAGENSEGWVSELEELCDYVTRLPA